MRRPPIKYDPADPDEFVFDDGSSGPVGAPAGAGVEQMVRSALGAVGVFLQP